MTSTRDIELKDKSASGAIDKLDWSSVTMNPKKINERNNLLDRISNNNADDFAEQNRQYFLCFTIINQLIVVFWIILWAFNWGTFK